MTEEALEQTGPRELARRLECAWADRTPIEPLSETDGLSDADNAYAVQQRWTEQRVAAGETVLGRKIGLTSSVVQRQLGVDEPDYGTLWGSRFFRTVGRRAEAPADVFVAPRVEGELAFLLGSVPPGPTVSPQEALVATEAIAPAIEIVDSRIADWRITLPDTVADNASFGGFVLGAWSRSLLDQDLRTVGMVLTRADEPVAEGVGAAALGHPARAVAWLLTRLAQLDVPVSPGDVVLSGALGSMTAAKLGDVFTLYVHRQQPVTLSFA